MLVITPVIPATQEDQGSKPVRANSLQDPIWKKTFTKIGLVEWLKVKALSSSPSSAINQYQSINQLKENRKRFKFSRQGNTKPSTVL
jgi:hypothetical protein